MVTHLVVSYSYPKGVHLPVDPDADDAIPNAACQEPPGPGDELADICDDGDESPVTCPACLAWLNDGDNRLKLLNIDGWIRKHVGDPNLWYFDVPMPRVEG